MNRTEKILSYLAIGSVAATGLAVLATNGSLTSLAEMVFTKSNKNNWTITKSDLSQDGDTFIKFTRNGNPIVFNKSENSVSNVGQITGLSSVSFSSSNEYVLISTGFIDEEMLYERYIRNNGTNIFNVSLKGECFVKLSSLDDETLDIDNLDIEYICSGSTEEYFDSRLSFTFDSKTNSYSVAAKSNKFKSTDPDKVCLIPMYFDDGINGKHPVTTIDSYGFNACYFTTLYLPSSITTLYNGAFNQCFRLNNVYVPNSITKFPSYTFSKCSDLTNIKLPETLTSIDSNTFDACTSLTDILLPNALSSMGSSTFVNCSKLTTVNCPTSIKELGNSTFYYCHSMIDYTVSKNVTKMGYYFFRNCNNIECLNYEGTITEWSKVKYNTQFYYSCPKLTTVHCVDGDVTL